MQLEFIEPFIKLQTIGLEAVRDGMELVPDF
jgi:hypothetical protein